MGRYNHIDTKPTKTTTYEGGEAYTKSVEDEWTNMLFSFILQNFQRFGCVVGGNYAVGHFTVDDACCFFVASVGQCNEISVR